VFQLPSLLPPRIARIAVIGALVAALGLAGCGRKGGLDPPPSAAAASTEGVPPGAAPQGGPNGQPPAPPPLPKHTPIDWLID
jgi:predicted small lipoprotein YifL